MLGGAYSSQFKNVERQHIDTIKTFAENEKMDSLARAKKLSLETNKRRRALALKRKNDSEREEKRRQQILAKRREKQKEATERFQRAHMPPRPVSGTSSPSGKWSPRRTTQLEDALRIVRGSPGGSRVSSARNPDRGSPTRSYYRQNSDPLSKPYFNKYAHPSINGTRSNVEKREELHNKSLHNLNASRNLFEKQLESHQQLLLEQQQNALKEFNNQLMKEVESVERPVTGELQNGNVERTESLTSVDSLEDTGSNDTLRESCDLDTFENKGNTPLQSDTGRETVSFMNHNVGGYQYNPSPSVPPSIDSYSAQLQAATNNGHHGQVRQDDKQQFYQQRQLEIQQQLEEQRQKQLIQQQQKQQQELQQQRLEQQQKQQQLLQEEFQRQQGQIQASQQQHQQPNYSSNNVHNAASEAEKENTRPKVQLKAWATPSPQPPTPVSVTTSTYTNNLVTNSSPYSARSTNTNMTTVTTYDKSVIKNGNQNVNSKPVSTPISQSEQNQSKLVQQTNDTYNNNNQNGSVQNRGFTSQGSFLDTVTKDLTKQQSDTTVISQQSNVPLTNTMSSTTNGSSHKTSSQQAAKSNINSPKPGTGSAVTGKPPASSSFYLNSYSSAYAVRQNLQQQQQLKQPPPSPSGSVPNGDPSRLNFRSLNSGQQTGDNPITLFQADGLYGDENQDTADTDSVSTICEEREPEPKEVKGILKKGGNGKGILKKSGSTGNMHNRNEIRDSLEITRVHLQTSAEEKEQRQLRELEGSKTQDVVTKKNVRFADLTYDEPSEDVKRAADGDKLFVKRGSGEGQNATSHQRPVSAVTIKSSSSRVDHKPPRASSATIRASTIPRAKTQVVKPQAAAHIIQSPPSTNGVHNMEKKVTIVNNNFMEKIPSMTRGGTQPVHTASPSMVYTVGSRVDPQKPNYAVSSIVMPKSNSAPFIYPGYAKDALQPSSSQSGPAQNVPNSKYDGAVYDENGVRIDRTPTDEEINFLWDKVRTCLSRNSNPGEKVQSPVSTVTEGHRQAAPVTNTYIDGNALGQFNSMTRVAGYGSNPAPIHRQNSLDSANGSYTKRFGLLQQRKQQPNPNSLKSRQQGGQGQGSQGYTVYHAPVPSYNEPVQTGQVNGDVSESMAEFLTAEQLAEQSVSESKIHQAMDEAQVRQQMYNTAKPSPKARSALSMEEQRLLESLDRLNDKLKVTDQNAQNSPHLQQQQQQQQKQQQPTPQQALHVSGFKGHQPIHSQRRVIESANPRARLKITSATLKKHLHRHQW